MSGLCFELQVGLAEAHIHGKQAAARTANCHCQNKWIPRISAAWMNHTVQRCMRCLLEDKQLINML